MDRFESKDPAPEGFHNPPSAAERSQSQEKCTPQPGPEGDGRPEGFTGGEEHEGDDTHLFLGVIGPVCKGHESSGDPVEPDNAAVGASFCVSQQNTGNPVQGKTAHKSDENGEQQKSNYFDDAGQFMRRAEEFGNAPVHASHPGGGNPGSQKSAHEGMGGGGRETLVPGQEVPERGTEDGGEEHENGLRAGVNRQQAEEREGDRTAAENRSQKGHDGDE